MSTLHPYIRPTDKKYGTEENGGFWGENGYNCIEVGYIEIDTENNVLSVIELTPCADVIDFGSLLELDKNMMIAMDCVGEGYLRLFTRKPYQTIRWQTEQIPLSQMSIVFGKPMEEFHAEEK